MQLTPDEVSLVKYLTANFGRKLILGPSLKARVTSLDRKAAMYELGLED